MEIKGISIESTKLFVQKKFGPEGFKKFIDALSPESRVLYTSSKVLTSSWYSARTGLVEPEGVICNLFYRKELKGAWDLGSFAAENALTGVYKFF